MLIYFVISFQILGHIYIEIAPVLAVAEYYLRQFELDDVISLYHPNEIKNISTDVDLLWNAISFQEMTPDIVAGYLKQIKRLNARRLCLIGQSTLRYGSQREFSWLDLVEEHFSVRSIGPGCYLGSNVNSSMAPTVIP